MLICPVILISGNPDTSRAADQSRFMYDLGIEIEPARESVPHRGIGVANPIMVRFQNQLDSLSLAFFTYKKVTQQQLEELIRENDSLKHQVRRMQRRVFQSPVASLAPPAKQYSKREGERFFRKGEHAYDNKNYGVAADYFSKALASEIPSMLVGDAYYWLASCHIRLRDEYLALEYLKKVMEYPLSEKVDDALFLAAVTYKQLGNTDMAALFLKRLLKRFPDGQLTKLANLELKRLETIQ